MIRECVIKFFLLSIILLVLASDFCRAQAIRTFKKHEIIEAGNGMKIEVLACRGQGDEEECDVIYYTDKRQLGKRKWEKSKIIIELEGNTVISQQKTNTSLKGNKGNKSAAVKKATISKDVKQKVVPEKVVVPHVVPKKDSSESVLRKTETKPDSLVDSQVAERKEAIKDTASPNVNTIQPTVTGYTLDQLYSTALSRNIGIKQAENNINISAIDRKTAQFGLLPSVEFNAGHYFSFGKNIDPVTNVFTYERFSGGYGGLGLELQLFSGFNRINSIKQSSYALQASEYARKKAELELLSNITLVYARVLFDKEQLIVLRSNIQSTTQQLEIINEMIKVGRVTKYEGYTFNARLNTEIANLVAVQNDSAAAVQDLRQILNVPYSQGLDIAPVDTSVFSTLYTTRISAPDLIETMLNTHPAIKQARMNEQAAFFSQKIAKSSLYPSLSVGGNLVSNYNNNNTTQTGQKIPLNQQINSNLGQNVNINLRIPIFSQFENANRVKKEKINVSNAQLAVQEAENTVVSNTFQLVNDFNAAKQAYLATRLAWEQNTLSFSLYQEKYKVGQVSSVELLTARDILNASTSKYLQNKLQLFFQYQLIELLKRY